MIEVEIEEEAWTLKLPEADSVAGRAAEAVILSSRQGGGGVAEELNVTILLTSDEAVRDLNARFRGKDAATNVLSFPAPASARPHLGDLALAYGVCARESAQQGKPLAHHLTHLVAHGVLHLLGYDHERDEEAEAMEALERRILAGLGVPDPYEAAA
jgi:probable rRNA maturation factor